MKKAKVLLLSSLMMFCLVLDGCGNKNGADNVASPTGSNGTTIVSDPTGTDSTTVTTATVTTETSGPTTTVATTATVTTETSGPTATIITTATVTTETSGTTATIVTATTGTDPTPVKVFAGAVSLTFDDGFFGLNMKQAFDKMLSYSIPGTLYIVTDWVGDDAHFTWSDIGFFASKGWEIGNHTKSHQHPLLVSTTNFVSEVDLAEVALRQHNIQAHSFSIPYGEGYNLVNDQVVLDGSLLNALNSLGYIKTSRQAFTGDNPTILNDAVTFNPMAVKVFSWKGTTSKSFIIGLIEQAVAQKQWLVLVIHAVATNPDPNDNDQISLTDFNAVCDYLNNSGVATTTISQGAVNFVNH